MSKTSFLIAMVPTAVMVNGERQIIQPGEQLPELKAADASALVTARAAREPHAEAASVRNAPLPSDAGAEAVASPADVPAPAPTPAPAPAPAPATAGKPRKR